MGVAELDPGWQKVSEVLLSSSFCVELCRVSAQTNEGIHTTKPKEYRKSLIVSLDVRKALLPTNTEKWIAITSTSQQWEISVGNDNDTYTPITPWWRRLWCHLIFLHHALDDVSGGCDDGDTSDGDVISTCSSSIMRRTLHPRSGRQLVKCTFAILHHRFGQV